MMQLITYNSERRIPVCALSPSASELFHSSAKTTASALVDARSKNKRHLSQACREHVYRN